MSIFTVSPSLKHVNMEGYDQFKVEAPSSISIGTDKSEYCSGIVLATAYQETKVRGENITLNLYLHKMKWNGILFNSTFVIHIDLGKPYDRVVSNLNNVFGKHIYKDVAVEADKFARFFLEQTGLQLCKTVNHYPDLMYVCQLPARFSEVERESTSSRKSSVSSRHETSRKNRRTGPRRTAQTK